MSLDWSFSTDRRMRRCPRQVFFTDIAAWHNAKDPLRRESYLLNQVRGLAAWRGSLVHQSIDSFIVPRWQQHRPVDWESVIEAARELGTRQFVFSENGTYRTAGMSKTKALGDYCALFPHEFDLPLGEEQLEGILESVERALRNLSSLKGFLARVENRDFYRSELALAAEFNGVRIKGQIDLFFSVGNGRYAVADWKDYESPSGSDAKRQMSLYAWLLLRNARYRVADPRDVELWEVKLSEPGFAVYAIDQESLDELEDFMYRSTEELRALCGDGKFENQSLEDFPHTENPNTCRLCPFRGICREPNQWITIASTFSRSRNQAA
jgi:PD-(D/E)XK nuclease superfamily